VGEIADDIIDEIIDGCWDFGRPTPQWRQFEVGSIKIETAKAWYMSVRSLKKKFKGIVWLPKSYCYIKTEHGKKYVYLPQWLYDSKVAELKASK
jgi:hypothetical protein